MKIRQPTQVQIEIEGDNAKIVAVVPVEVLSRMDRFTLTLTRQDLQNAIVAGSKKH